MKPLGPLKDEDVEALLRRYRPITRLPDSPIARWPRTWPWAVAAAALLAITFSLHAGVQAPEVAADPRRVQGLADQLGGGAEAHALATAFVLADTASDANGAADPASPPGAR